MSGTTKPASESANETSTKDATARLSSSVDITEEQNEQSLQLIIGLGASAGGLKPLEEFFKHVNPNAGHAYIVIQHLSPDFKSLMSELLSRQTSMPVQRAEDEMIIQPNQVYLIPPRKELTIAGYTLHVDELTTHSAGGAHFPIDIFFRSLAHSAETRAVGIILSGTGSDGSRGVRAIDDAGGLVLVQDEATAQFDGMPATARATGTTSLALAPDRLAALVSDLKSNWEASQALTEQLDEKSEYDKIISKISRQTHNDFSAYRIKTLKRRIERRRLITATSNLAEYHQLLLESHEEREQLAADFLIHVTAFFRDENVWKSLLEEALPTLIQSIPLEVSIRIWVAACSTGEEAYTMAILVLEAMEALGRNSQQLKIFATDVDQTVLDRASAGVYPQSVVADIPEKYLKKYFTASGESYIVSRRLREQIIFAPHNLLSDAPFTRTHLVTCRNVLIYFRPEIQERIVSMIHFSLVPNGIALLGASESLGKLANEFKPVNEKSSIFAKIRNTKLTIAPGFANPSPKRRNMAGKPDARIRVSYPHGRALDDALQALALERNWVCLLCNSEHELMHAIGETGGLLRVAPGEVSVDAPKLVPNSLSLPLKSALNRAQRERITINHKGIKIIELDAVFDLQVIYRQTTSDSAELLIVVIKKVPQKQAHFSDLQAAADSPTAQLIHNLDYELQQTRQDLHATIEQLETTNEEQQATNEELTTANEELQSTNEELHSVNEELYTVNAEYQQKISELTEMTNDMENLLESTDIGVVFLDNTLRIRRYTPAATRSVHMVSSDIGRPFNDLSYEFEYPDLKSDLNRVLSLGEAVEREVHTNKSTYLLVRIHPYRAGSELTIGVVITFVNISELKKVEDALAQVESKYRHLFQSEMFGVLLGDLRNRAIVDANDALLSLLHYDRLDLPLLISNVYAESDQQALERSLNELQESGHTSPAPVLLKRADGMLVPVIIGRTLIDDADGNYVALVLATDQLTNKAGQRLEEKARELETVRDNLQQFAYTTSHHLYEPLRAVAGFTQIIEDEFADVLGEKGKDYLKYITDGTKQLTATIEDLLLFSRVHTHAAPVTDVDTAVLVNTILSQIERPANASPAEVEVGDLPIVVGDPIQLKQVFHAIIENAFKFSGISTPTITVKAHEADDQWQFSISDRGIGIDPAKHKSVFTMFETITTSTGESSRGVGLAVAKRIVERHHGKIWIEGSLESGTIVHFTLPVKQPNQ